MSRVDSVRLAIEKARDGVARRGARLRRLLPVRRRRPSSRSRPGAIAIIQPGGSIRDPESVAAVDAAGATMVFTSRRHFRH